MSYLPPNRSQPIKRKRGIILSPKGWQRLQSAEQRSVNQTGGSKPYTLQELSERTGLSPNTLARVRSRKVAVDQQTLETYFRSFDLALGTEDYADSETGISSSRHSILLSGQLTIDSPLYVPRPPCETTCYEALQQPGAIVRIKAPRQMGKTSLAARTLASLRDQKMATVMLSLQLADNAVFSDLQRFLQWMCAIVTRNLGLPNQLEAQWDDLFGNSYNCTNYFENCILMKLDTPLVLALDEVDVVFEYPAIASDFLGMLRAWYEKARYGDGQSELWQKLRIVLIHSTEVYVPLNVHQSPFNAGLSIDLPPFTHEQIQDLAQRYDVEHPAECVNQILELTGGVPYLVQAALHHLSGQTVSIEQLIYHATAIDGIYGPHLRQCISDLQQYPELLEAWKQVVTSPAPIEIEMMQAFKLQSKGLVKIHDQKVTPSCTLYRDYFRKMFAEA